MQGSYGDADIDNRHEDTGVVGGRGEGESGTNGESNMETPSYKK